MKCLCRLLVCSVLAGGWLESNFTVRAGQYFQDFTGSSVGATTFADGALLSSTALGTVARVTDANLKELQLMASGATFTKSAFLLPDLDPGNLVYAFSAKWNGTLSGNFPDTAADGFSFNFGQLRSLDLLGGNVEGGYNTGLCFSVQTWTGAAPGFYLKVNGGNIATLLTNNPGAVWGTNSATRHFFEVDWNWTNGLTVRLDGQVLFLNVSTIGFIPRAGDSFAWGTRVGLYSETVALDNITILTGGNLAPLAMGAPYYYSGENPPNETAAKAFDGNPGTKWLTAGNHGAVIGAQAQGAAAIVRAYAVTSANDVPARDPRQWTLQQMNSDSSWADRASGSGFFYNRFEQRAWAVADGLAATAFRLNITTNYGAPETQLSELTCYRFDPVQGTVATTTAATGVSNTTATLNGTVNPVGAASAAWFEWCNNTNYGYVSSSAPVAVGNGYAAVPVSASISGLAAGAPYYYRTVASNAYGIFRAAPQFFQPVALQLIGPNPLTNECHVALNDPGATTIAPPLAFSAGSSHSLALRADHTVVAWGAGTYNANFVPNYGQAIVPGGLANVVALAAASFHSLALRSDGVVVAWGYNNKGQLGINGTAGARAIAGGLEHSVALLNNGTVVGSGSSQYGQLPAPAAATNIMGLDAGEYHNLAVRSNGTVIAWGAGTTYDPAGFVHYGQSLVPASATNVIAVAAGAYHSLALRADGTLVGWGAGTNYNPGDLQSYNQSIIPANATNVMAIAAGGQHNLALRRDGSLVAWGNNDSGQATVPPEATNVIAIAAGYNWNLALRADGAVLGWGNNNFGIPDFNLAYYGQATIPSTVTNISQPTSVTGAVDVNSPGIYQLTYTSANAFGALALSSRTIVVSDTVAPVLTLLGGNPLFWTYGTPFVEPGYAALDACEGDDTTNVLVSGSVTINVPGTNILTYSVSDATGHLRTTNRTVLVIAVPTIANLAGQMLSTNSVTGTRTLTLTGTITPNGQAAGAWFQFGLNPSYGGATNVATYPGNFIASPISLTVSNLLADVPYHFRVIATNSVGTAVSSDQVIAITPAFPRGDHDGDGLVSQAELDAVLANYFATSPWLKMTNTLGLGGTNVSFELTNSLAGSYGVEVSSNLVDWVRLGVAAPRFQFTDTNAPTGPQRYYRLRWP